MGTSESWTLSGSIKARLFENVSIEFQFQLDGGAFDLLKRSSDVFRCINLTLSGVKKDQDVDWKLLIIDNGRFRAPWNLRLNIWAIEVFSDPTDKFVYMNIRTFKSQL